MNPDTADTWLYLDIMKSVKPAIYFATLIFRYIEIWHLGCKNIPEIAGLWFDSDVGITGVNIHQKICLLTAKNSHGPHLRFVKN